MSTGKVFLVGAGPGDPGLVTLKGLRCIESADVVVYDRLVDRRLLSRAASNAELIDAGKFPGEGGKRQAKINALLVDRAKQGYRVVRLKGGDPFVFGRGGEEAELLHDQGVPFESGARRHLCYRGPCIRGYPADPPRSRLLLHRGYS